MPDEKKRENWKVPLKSLQRLSEMASELATDTSGASDREQKETRAEDVRRELEAWGNQYGHQLLVQTNDRLWGDLGGPHQVELVEIAVFSRSDGEDALHEREDQNRFATLVVGRSEQFVVKYLEVVGEIQKWGEDFGPLVLEHDFYGQRDSWFGSDSCRTPLDGGDSPLRQEHQTDDRVVCTCQTKGEGYAPRSDLGSRPDASKRFTKFSERVCRIPGTGQLAVMSHTMDASHFGQRVHSALFVVASTGQNGLKPDERLKVAGRLQGLHGSLLANHMARSLGEDRVEQAFSTLRAADRTQWFDPKLAGAEHPQHQFDRAKGLHQELTAFARKLAVIGEGSDEFNSKLTEHWISQSPEELHEAIKRLVGRHGCLSYTPGDLPKTTDIRFPNFNSLAVMASAFFPLSECGGELSSKLLCDSSAQILSQQSDPRITQKLLEEIAALFKQLRTTEAKPGVSHPKHNLAEWQLDRDSFRLVIAPFDIDWRKDASRHTLREKMEWIAAGDTAEGGVGSIVHKITMLFGCAALGFTRKTDPRKPFVLEPSPGLHEIGMLTVRGVDIGREYPGCEFKFCLRPNEDSDEGTK